MGNRSNRRTYDKEFETFAKPGENRHCLQPPEYKSQKEKKYTNETFIRSLSHTRGVSIDADYAEAFEVVRWVIE